MLKGNHLFAFPQKVVWDNATATESFDLSVYDIAKQVSYNNGKFSLESSTEGDKRVFTAENTKEMLLWLRNIHCIQQSISSPKISFIDQSNKRTPYVNF